MNRRLQQLQYDLIPYKDDQSEKSQTHEEFISTVQSTCNDTGYNDPLLITFRF